MDELVVANVDANVREGFAQGIEVHQIARLQVFLFYGFSQFADFCRGARQLSAVGFAEDITNQSAAIKAVFGRAAAAAVVNANERHRFDREPGGAISEA